MAITARELVFYVRAEDQASRVVKRAARSFGSLSNIRALENKAIQQNVTNLRNLDAAQQRIRANEQAIQKARIASARVGPGSAANLAAQKKITDISQQTRRNEEQMLRQQAQASRLTRLVSSGRPLKGYTVAETQNLQKAAVKSVETLGKQNDLLKKQGILASQSAAKVAVEQNALREASLTNLATLTKQEELLAQDLEEVRRKGLAASAAIDQQISQAKIGRLQSYITEVQNLARAIRLIGVVALASFAFAAHAAANFSTQVALAASQARPIGAPAGAALPIQSKIQDQILKQMKEFPATSEEMANSFYQIFSGTNIQGVKEAARYVKLFNEAAVGGQASLDEMTQAGISIKNVFGIGVTGEFKNMTQALNVFFSAVRYGRMTASQFAQALGYISPIAKDVSLSFRNIAEDMAFFTRQTGGRMTRQDAQGLARLIQLLARQDVVQGLAQKGIPVFDKLTHRMRPVVDIIKQIHDQLRLTPQETVNFFKTISASGSGKGGTQGTIQAIRIFSQGIQNVKAYQDVVKHVRKDNDEFINSYNQLSKAPGIRWKVFTNQIRAAILVIGGQAIPAFIKLGEPLARLIHWFNGLSDGAQHTIATVGVFGSAAAILGGTLVIIAGSMARLVLTFKELRLISIASEAGFTSVGLALRLGMLGALILLVPLMIRYHTQIGNVVSSLGGLKVVLGLITGALLALKLAPVIDQLGLAAFKAGTLKDRMLFLSKMGGITFGITLLFASKGDKGVKGIVERILGGAMAGGAVGGVPGAAIGTAVATAPDLYRLGQHIRHNVLGINDTKPPKSPVPEQFRRNAKTVQAYLKGLRGSAPPPNMGPPSNLMRTNYVLDAYEAGREAGRHKVVTTASQAVRVNVARATRGLPPLPKFDANAAIQNVLKLNRIAEKSPSQKNFKNYYQALANLRKHYTGTDLEALDAYLSAVESATNKSSRKVASNAKKAADALKQQLKDAQANVMSMYDNLLQQNQSVMGQLFQGPYVQSPSVQDRLQYGGLLSGGDLLKDLQSQNKQFSNFYNTIDKLRRRGAPQELIQQLIQAGPQALPAIKALAGMGDKQWKIYIQTFNRGQDLLHKQTIAQLRSQLKDYRKYGQNIALQIISGMRDKRLGLSNEIRSIIKQMFGVKTPVVARAARKNVANASRAAATRPHHTPHHAPTGATTHTHPIVGTGSRTTQSARPEINYNYYVTAPTSEHASVETQLRHAEFASRTKHKNHP